VNQDG